MTNTERNQNVVCQNCYYEGRSNRWSKWTLGRKTAKLSCVSVSTSFEVELATELLWGLMKMRGGRKVLPTHQSGDISSFPINRPSVIARVKIMFLVVQPWRPSPIGKIIKTRLRVRNVQVLIYEKSFRELRYCWDLMSFPLSILFYGDMLGVCKQEAFRVWIRRDNCMGTTAVDSSWQYTSSAIFCSYFVMYSIQHTTRPSFQPGLFFFPCFGNLFFLF